MKLYIDLDAVLPPPAILITGLFIGRLHLRSNCCTWGDWRQLVDRKKRRKITRTRRRGSIRGLSLAAKLWSNFGGSNTALQKKTLNLYNLHPFYFL